MKRYDLIIEKNNGVLFVLKNNKWSVVDREYKPIIPLTFDVMPILTDYDRCIICKKDGKFGVFDLDGKEILPIKYNDVENLGDKKFIVTEGTKKCIIDVDKNIQKEYECDRIRALSGGYYYVEKSKRVGLLDSDYNVVIPTEYGCTIWLDENYAFLGDGKGGVILFNLRLREKVTKKSYKKIEKISDEYVAVMNFQGKWGVLDILGNVILPCKYEKCYTWSDITTVSLKRRGKFGIINVSNMKMVDCIYDAVKHLYGNSFIVTKNKKQGIINSNNKEILPCEYDSITTTYSGGMNIHVTQDGLEGLLDCEYKFIIPVKYKNIRVVNEYAIITNYSGLEGLVELKTGRLVCEPKYRQVGGVCLGDFSNGFVRVQNHERLYGYIDANGKEVIPCKYIDAENFYNGYAVVAKTRSNSNYYPIYGYINNKGEEVTKFMYREAGSVGSSGEAKVEIAVDREELPCEAQSLYSIKGKISLKTKETSDNVNKI